MLFQSLHVRCGSKIIQPGFEDQESGFVPLKKNQAVIRLWKNFFKEQRELFFAADSGH
jgi:hypothetical protein